jgi:hypothetical protein
MLEKVETMVLAKHGVTRGGAAAPAPNGKPADAAKPGAAPDGKRTPAKAN